MVCSGVNPVNRLELARMAGKAGSLAATSPQAMALSSMSGVIGSVSGSGEPARASVQYAG